MISPAPTAPLTHLLTRLAVTFFSTTPAAPYKQPSVPGSDIPIPSPTAKMPEIPDYPYGPRQVYKQSNTGLYGSQRIRFGNNVSEKFEIKTRRAWRPNVQHKRLWSDSLGVFVRTRVTTRVLRTIDKVGGLDNYLLGHKAQRIKDLGPWGWRLRWRIMQTPAIRERLAKERAALGLPPKEDVGEWIKVEGSQVARDALIAEVDKKLQEDGVFELSNEASAGPSEQDIFMKEQKPRTQ
ncbi:mitochondrial 54S ribosomal protein bL28m [Thermochaetoides thermophila DSM 1495]|uniref:Large ribosomal subunit protein bL28m n=1 Tax=Chaetomium thermophilum (strain DSM 1495 / CBS 144.50 / IMI 039719) TaxID=759272 RepID=G0RYU6_CHATD|nr:hypothetical protein CTHT_0000620 [Thermochaetoides thermophila DSM 1495]EGS23374.1 hypothetical protein CTHT_0000620 [Thermochaetoides thermophila DSM 1495]